MSRALVALGVGGLLAGVGSLSAQQGPSNLGWRFSPGPEWHRPSPPPASPEAAAARWGEEVRQQIAAARRRRWLASGDGTAPVAQEQAAPLELGFAFRGRFELKVDQLRNDRCTAGDIGNPFSGCRTGFPTPFLDQQFTLRAGGVVSDRVHLNVDYDSEREFSANNDIHVWYEGGPGDLVQRVEVGNVTLEAPGSRFITAAIPANSFGIQARAGLGHLEVRTIVAQQRGSALRTRVFTIGQRTTQPVDFELRDVDFETGRFFFAVNPALLPGYPDLDPLNLGEVAVALPATLRPVDMRIYRLRALSGTVGANPNPNLGGINAVALRADSPQRVGPLPWELLVEGRDYYLDPSGLWFALGTRVGSEEYLAVSYVTAAGDTVGTFPAVGGGSDTLELIYEPRRGPEVPTFAYEMRNVYRLGGPDVDRASLTLAVLLNRSERPVAGGAPTYLAALGLARSADPAALDEYSRVFPRERDPDAGAPIRDLFVIFPNLTPFADPARLAPAELNDSLYRTPTYLLSTQGPAPRFRLRVHYEATGAGDRSGINLGAIQVREGSEKLYIGDRQLIRGRDYEIFYDIGQVTFLNPDALFAGPVQIRAQFEENQLFDVAPRSIYGLSGTWHLGEHGRIDAIGLAQREQSVFTRPQLGFEPQANFIGGLSTQLAFSPDGLTRALDALPLIGTTAPSALTVSGELAVSRPNANQVGQAYIEEFEGTTGTRAISLNEQDFHLGSRPESGRGVPPAALAADGSFAALDAATLVWQNGVSVGDRPIEFGPRDIDSTIVLAGTARQIERVLWLTLKSDTIGGAPDPVTGQPRWFRPHRPAPRWRSISQPLDRSGLGIDLSTAEYLEFWVLEDEQRTAAQQNAALVLDFGTTFEDAIAPAPDTLQVTGADSVFSGLQFVGVGRLDTEKDSLTNAFNAAVNDLGILGDRPDSIFDGTAGSFAHDLPLCRGSLSTGLPIFPLGDLAARCTRGNGLLDTEDLNGDNRLDLTLGAVQEDVVRYVLPLGSTTYFVREGGSTVDAVGRRLTWRLYRIPFRQDTLLIGNPDVRHIRDLRLTLVAPDQGVAAPDLFIALARVRLLGAPWLKRAPSPMAGLGGSLTQSHGEVVASIVSTDNRDLGYTSPPGVLNEADRRGTELQFTSEQINEHSLRLLARDLRLDERAEAFTRFAAEADRSFLKYRQLRVWAQGRGEGWNDGQLEFFVKVGSDENNFYLYRTSLVAGTWEPEIVVDLARWIALRTQVESTWLSGAAPQGAATCGGDSTAYVACDGPYLVQVRDPSIAPPNLARVSEIAVGMRRVAETTLIDPAEVWVDDIRLGDVVNDAGVAGAIEARLVAADVAELSAGFTRRDGQFRQLEEDPSYVTDASAHLASTLRLDKLLPSSWNLSVPVTVTLTHAGSDPFYLSQTDIRASGLSNVRRPTANTTTYQFAFRRTERGGGLTGLLLDPLALSGYLERGDARSELTSATTRNQGLRLDYDYRPGPVGVPAAPGFLRALLEHLPSWIRESAFGKSLRTAELRLNPAEVYVRSSLVDDVTRRSTFRVAVHAPGDSAIAAVPSVVHLWNNLTGIELRPFETFSVRAEYSSLRDLQQYGDSTLIGQLLGGERRRWLGQDVGFERQRSLGTSANVAPVVSSWLKPRVVLSTGFNLIRDPNRRLPVSAGPDSTGPLRVPLTASNNRRRQFGTGLELAQLAPAGGVLHSVLGWFLPADIALTRERRSIFDGLADVPAFGYELALGDVDAFRRMGIDLANTAFDSRTLTASGGTALPTGFRIRLNYRDSRGTTWARRGDAQVELLQTSTEWPSGSFSWTFAPTGFVRRVIGQVDARADYRNNETALRQVDILGGGAGAATENRVWSFQPSLNVTWVSGIATGAQFGRSRSDLITAGSTTRSDRTDAGASLRFSLPVPSALLRFSSPLRATISGQASDVTVCLFRAGSSECTAVADTRRRQLDARLDTGFSPTVVGGATFSYISTDQRHLSSRLSQIVFTVFAEINFLSGRVP